MASILSLRSARGARLEGRTMNFPSNIISSPNRWPLHFSPIISLCRASVKPQCAPMLSPARKAEFAERGFIVLRGAVPAAAIAVAREKIDRSLADDTSIGRNRWFADNSFCPDLVRDPTIFALLRGTGLLCAVEELFGGSGTARVNDSAQIALRFPDMRAEPGHWGPHIDGFPAGTNQVAPGEVWRQTALVGVYLS